MFTDFTQVLYLAVTPIPINIQVDGVDFERVHGKEFLGVTIADKINWQSHIKKFVENKLKNIKTRFVSLRFGL